MAEGSPSIFEAPFLARRTANFAALTPLSFLSRAATVYPDKIAVIHGARRYAYREFYERCCRLADALRRRGIDLGDTVSVMAPNVPALLEAHYGVAMAGGVLNALNYRLDARSIAFILDHGGAKVLLTDREFSATIRAAPAVSTSTTGLSPSARIAVRHCPSACAWLWTVLTVSRVAAGRAMS